ncbi:unnamed protein product [Lepidochelys kempii]
MEKACGPTDAEALLAFLHTEVLLLSRENTGASGSGIVVGDLMPSESVLNQCPSMVLESAVLLERSVRAAVDPHCSQGSEVCICSLQALMVRDEEGPVTLLVLQSG